VQEEYAAGIEVHSILLFSAPDKKVIDIAQFLRIVAISALFRKKNWTQKTIGSLDLANIFYLD
jgi:hypothetical protein